MKGKKVVENKVQHSYYVAPNGNDTYEGSETAPFRTIACARDYVRSINQAMEGDIVVYLEDGIYKLDEPITFTEQDSGTNGFRIIYKAKPNAQPILTSGITLKGWALHDQDKGIYKVRLDQPIDTRQLYVNGERATRARSIAGLSHATYDADGHTTTDTFLADFKCPSDLEMVYIQAWTNPRCGVKSIQLSEEGDKAIIEMKQPGWYYCRNKGMTSTTVPVYYENAYELLDTEGEWYLDKTGVVDGQAYTMYYKPRKNECLEESEVIIPTLEQLIQIEGSDLDHLIQDIVFEGITFEYTTWLRPSTHSGHPDAQNNVIREYFTPEGQKFREFVEYKGAVLMKYAHQIEIEQCHFRNLGYNGVMMDRGCQHNVIRGCTFADVAATGVQLGNEYDRYEEENNNPSDERSILKYNQVVNNYFTRCAVEYMTATAIGACYPQELTIAHNEIGHLPYSGIHIGWGWQFIQTPTKNNYITHNLMYKLRESPLTDGGGMYTVGGNIGGEDWYSYMTENHIIEEQFKHNYTPLFHDEGSTWWKDERNVIECKEGLEWSSMWIGSIHDIHLDSNYTGSHRYNNSGVNCSVTNTQVITDENWPEEAKKVMKEAGLEEGYTHIKQAVKQPSMLQLDQLKVNIENMQLTKYIPEKHEMFSNGFGVKAPHGMTGEARFKFTGATGKYLMNIVYIAAGDQAKHTLFINDKKVDEWDAEVGESQKAYREVAVIQINQGDIICITGQQKGTSLARLDYMELKPIE